MTARDTSGTVVRGRPAHGVVSGRFPGPGRLACALLALVLGIALSPPSALAQNADGARDPVLDALQAAAESSDQSALAAQTLLQAILDDSSRAESYRAFLDRVLALDNLRRNARDVPVAEKLVTALGFLAASGKVFPGGADKLRPLIGFGPPGLRREVRKALLGFIRAEIRAAPTGESPTFRALGEQLTTNSPPPAPVMREISLVLREVDPKALLGLLVQGMLKNSGATAPRENTGVYIAELRDLLLLDLPTVEAWEAWWRENRSKGFHEILAEGHQRFHEQRVQLWQRTFQKVRESANPERYLGVLADTFAVDFTRAMREAVLDAYGAFPAWLRDTRFTGEIPGVGVIDDAARARYLERAARRLLAVVDGTEDPHVSREVKRAALSALAKYNGHVIKSPELEAAVATVLHRELESVLASPVEDHASGLGSAARHLYALELVRTVGALRIHDEEIHAILKGVVQDELDGRSGDVDLLTEAVVALGRILERSVEIEVVDMLISLHARVRGSTAEPMKRLRNACVTGLKVQVDDAGARERVRTLYSSVLERPDERPERIPAVIGLGILARAGDDRSVELLKGVLASRDEYEPSEVVAVIDALAYLGGREALECFVDFVNARDKPFADQVWQKVLTILKGGNQELFAWLIKELERRGFESDVREYSSALVRLAADPDAGGYLSGAKVNFADRAAFLRFWESALARIHAHEVLGQETEALGYVAQLSELVVKSEKASALRPEIGRELAAIRSRLDEKTALRAALRAPKTLETRDLVSRFKKILLMSVGDPAARWRGLTWALQELQGLEAGPDRSKLVAAIDEALSQPDMAPLWDGIPERRQALFRKELLAAGTGAPAADGDSGS